MNAPGILSQAVEKYLDERQRLGFRMADTEIRRFGRYADERGHKGPLTAELQIAWARLHVRQTSSGTGTRRLETIRPFVRHYCQYEPATVVVDPSVLGPSRGRLTPHIYTADELSELLVAAAAFEGGDGLRGATFVTLFGLIAATGLRLSEALQLMDGDVDAKGLHLTVRQTKFRKTRWLPLQASTARALLRWRKERDRHWASGRDSPFLVGSDGKVLKARAVESVFEGLRHSLNWKARGAHPQPRIHDLRHTFAVRRVQLWYEQGTPIEQAMFWLCTYLGHAKISDTYWYLTGVPELMAIASHRFEDFATAKTGAGGA